MAHILLVDDDVQLVIGMRDILELDYYTTLVFIDPRETLAYLNALDAESAPENLPDLAIFNYMMPYIYGDILARRVRKSPHIGHIPIILTTAKGFTLDEVQAAGMNDLLILPFYAEELLLMVERLLK